MVGGRKKAAAPHVDISQIVYTMPMICHIPAFPGRKPYCRRRRRRAQDYYARKQPPPPSGQRPGFV